MIAFGKFSRPMLLTTALVTAFLVFAVPDTCAAALQSGLRLCGGPLLVSLFPFLIVSSLLVRCRVGGSLGFFLRPVARVIGLRSPCAAGVLLVGLCGGFAPAANAAAEGVRSGELSAEEAAALLPAAVCSGPSFVILTVGETMLGSRALGVRLFLAQVLAGWLSAALLNRWPRPQEKRKIAEKRPNTPPAPRLDAVISDAAITYLKLCGFVLYFRLLASGVAAFLPEKLAALPAMLLEVSSGCDIASRTGLWAGALCCAALSIQGVSVLLQVRTICPKEISFRPLLTARLLHLPISLALYSLFLPKEAVETLYTMTGRLVPMCRVPLDCALLVFFVCCLLACELCRASIRLSEARARKTGREVEK